MWIFQISGYPENKSCKMDMVRDINPSIVVAKATFNKTLFTSKLDLCLRKKLVKRYICSTALSGVDTWHVGK